MKGQLGERLPGAFAIAAKVMKLSTPELGKQLKLGRILAKDLIPKLSKEYQRLVKDSGALALALKSTSFVTGRLSEEWNKLLNRLGEGGTGDALRNLMIDFTNVFKESGEKGGVLDTVLSVLVHTVRALGDVLFGTLVGWGLLSEEFAKADTLTQGLIIAFAAIAAWMLPISFIPLAILALVYALSDLWGWSKGKESFFGALTGWDTPEDMAEAMKTPFASFESWWNNLKLQSLWEKIFGKPSKESFTDIMSNKLADWFPGSGFDEKNTGRVQQQIALAKYNFDTDEANRLQMGLNARAFKSKTLDPLTATVNISNITLPNAVDGPSLINDLQSFIGTQVPFRMD